MRFRVLGCRPRNPAVRTYLRGCRNQLEHPKPSPSPQGFSPHPCNTVVRNDTGQAPTLMRLSGGIPLQLVSAYRDEIQLSSKRRIYANEAAQCTETIRAQGPHASARGSQILIKRQHSQPEFKNPHSKNFQIYITKRNH